MEVLLHLPFQMEAIPTPHPPVQLKGETVACLSGIFHLETPLSLFGVGGRARLCFGGASYRSLLPPSSLKPFLAVPKQAQVGLGLARSDAAAHVHPHDGSPRLEAPSDRY